MNPNVRKVLLDAPSLMVNGRVRYGQLAQCIALRPVAEGYNGNACTVRRSTDNTSQDVGFLGTELDNFSLMNFVGSENLLTYSEEMDNAIWIKAGLTVTNNAAIAPDGTLTADLLSNTTTESIYQQTTLPAASGSPSAPARSRGRWACRSARGSRRRCAGGAGRRRPPRRRGGRPAAPSRGRPASARP